MAAIGLHRFLIHPVTHPLSLIAKYAPSNFVLFLYLCSCFHLSLAVRLSIQNSSISYLQFQREYAVAVKVLVVEGPANRDEILPLSKLLDVATVV